MILPDVNLLIYAVDETSPFHSGARAWWDETLSGSTPVALCYPVALGFVRLTTHRRVFDHPLSVEEALHYIDSWLGQPVTEWIMPQRGHWARVSGLLRDAGVAGGLTTDAHLAALAIEHDVLLCSNDSDFGRFKGLRWRNPLVADS